MALAPSTCQRINSLAVMALVFCVLFSGCTRATNKIIYGQESKSSKISSVTITPPSSIQPKIQSGDIDALSLEIVPGECADGTQGTRLKKTTLQLSGGQKISDIKLKSRCEYKIFIEMGKLDPNNGSLGKVYLSNATSPTVLTSQDVQGENVKAKTTLMVTAEGQSVISGNLLDNNPQPINPQPTNPQPMIPQQQITPQSSLDTSDAGALRLDFMRYVLPAGYRIAQTAKDGETRMASVTRESKRLVLYSRSDQCQLKSFVSSSAQTVSAETTYKSVKEINWSTMITKFSSSATGKTTYNGLFIYMNGSRCAFGYVTADRLEQAQAEMKSVLDGASLVQ